MRLPRYTRIVVIGTTFLAAAFLFGTQFSTAGDVSPDQLLLKTSDLPQGTQVQIQGPLAPGSWNNGLVNEDGTDIVQGYINGVRVDYMAPLIQVESIAGTRSMARTYIANLVYRFADQQAAASEFQRLKGVFSSFVLVSTPRSIHLPGRQSDTFEIGGDSEVPYATMRWLLVQRGKFLIVLAMPGSLQASALGPAKQSIDIPLTTQAIGDYNQAVDDLFATTTALLQSR